ncbi:pyrroline-5-carboxylate reductase [Hyphobacterium sp. CCMP332]|uniref:pyrroline-5-carboxylate reductase n=1 Tax=Hyphobacterium sp. CCMP332 TaxID=2749086 RepID=UPI00164F7D6C|nr:pyrroline-5-carboxylate reductase [Hyphobacterium sp. CCMP332]QNL18169.1 pyrroline-5-carboxylate reductase [Hyphobacterium sp. CCMP332]
MTTDGRIALIGAGRMGGALAAGWLRGKGKIDPARLLICAPNPTDEMAVLIKTHGLKCVDALGPRMAKDVSLVVLAVKPQIFHQIAGDLAKVLPDNCAIISVMAGVTIRTMTEALGDRPIIRAMPNTPAAIGAGIIVAVANDAGEARQAEATKLLKVGGSVEWISDERMMDAVTAVSGSGPAYFFLLAEALAGAGENEGLPRDLAEKLATNTLIGAGELLKRSDLSPQELRRQVTSPNGTTQAALDVMMGNSALPELMRRAVNAAERRSRQLSDPNR